MVVNHGLYIKGESMNIKIQKYGNEFLAIIEDDYNKLNSTGKTKQLAMENLLKSVFTLYVQNKKDVKNYLDYLEILKEI